MSGLKITCERCASEIEHVCNEDLPEAGVNLFRFTMDADFKTVLKRNKDFYEEGDEKAPFFSERFLYSLLGKGDARTVLAVVNNLIRAAGLDPDALQTKALADYYENERENVQIQKDKEERVRRREEQMRPVSECTVDGVKVLTYRSFQALDNAIYEIERGLERTKKQARTFGPPKVNTKSGMLTIAEPDAKVIHEVALSSVRTWLRFRYVLNYRDQTNSVDRSFRAGNALKPVLTKLIPEVAALADAEAKPTHTTADGGRIFSSARALDEALHDARIAYGEFIKRRQEEIAKAKVFGTKPISDDDVNLLLSSDNVYGSPRIVGEYAVIAVHNVEYGARVTDIQAEKPEDMVEGTPLSTGYNRLRRFVLKSSGSAAK